jgi:hypothetical protein
MDNTERLQLINEHRTACGYQPFAGPLSDQDLSFHEGLIETHAPYGEDPWRLWAENGGEQWTIPEE